MSRPRPSSPSGPLLSTFQKHIEDMRNLVLCKVCIKPLYEPYILTCGHTYCYTCLASWFGGANKRTKRNCPDCRAQVTIQPSPNYLLRDLVHMFISRTELLPEDETTHEHDEAKRAEAQQIEADRSVGGQGLFKGAFSQHNKGGRPFINAAGPIHDHEDGVDRCPECYWELEDGMCAHCGYNEDSDAEFSEEDDDDGTRSVATPSIVSISSEMDGEIDLEDHDLDTYDEYWEPFSPEQMAYMDQPRLGHRHGNYRSRTVHQRWREALDGANARVSGGDGYSDYESDGDHTTTGPDRSDMDDDEDDDEDDEDGSISASEEDDSDTDIPIPTSYRRRQQQFPQVEDSPSEPQSPDSVYTETPTAGRAEYGFSPARFSSPDNSDQENEDPYRHNNITGSSRRIQGLPSGSNSEHRASNPIPRRPARRVVDTDDEESDGDTPTPPRSAADRRAHLEGQRARRGGGRGRGRPRLYRGR